MWHKVRNYVFLILGLVIIVSLVVLICKPRPVVQWSRNFNGGSGRSVQQTTDGGYIVCGHTFCKLDWITLGEQLWLVKTNADGNKIWSKTLGGIFGEYGSKSVQQTTDGGYIVCGSQGGSFLLMKIAPVWSKCPFF
jgi:hypothetical protein